jgi:hypothetical protein
MREDRERPEPAPPEEDPTLEADQADPTSPGPGYSDGARPEPEDR